MPREAEWRAMRALTCGSGNARRSRVVAVPARAALLPEAAEGVQLLEQVRRVLARGQPRPARLARGEHDIQAAQVGDREAARAESRTPTSTRSTCSGSAPSSSMNSASRERRDSMRLATKPSPAPTSTGTLPRRRPSFRRVATDFGGGVGRAHDLQQAHRVRGIEEVHARHLPGAAADACASCVRSRNEVLLARIACG